MKFYICEGKPDGEYNASSKARKDVEYILNELKFKKFFIPTKYGVQTNKLLKFKQLLNYYTNYKIWLKEIKKLKENDIVLIQYPLVNTSLNMDKVLKILKTKKVISVILIHDLDSLRFTNMPRVEREDRTVLKEASYIISHNEKMKEKLKEISDNMDNNVVELKIFDYISENEIESKKREKNGPVIIAGNLSKEKAEYLRELKNVKDVQFNLYGKGYSKEDGEENINYKGAFLPEELLNNLEGSFGLVWDGTSKKSCQGPYGEYLKYNNPHKASLYLTACLPVIVWKNAAIADFVLENNVGIVVENLDSIYGEIQKLTDAEYEKMIQNATQISENLRKGKYLKEAIDNIEKCIFIK